MSRNLQRGTYVPNLKDLCWLLWPWMQKMNFAYFWLWSRSKWPDYNETQARCVVPPTKGISSFELISQSMLKKVRKTRTDGHRHGIIRLFFKRACVLYLDVVPAFEHNPNVFGTFFSVRVYIRYYNLLQIGYIDVRYFFMFFNIAIWEQGPKRRWSQ